MKIDRLKVKDFRNLKNMEIEFGAGLNVICGQNGAGKTNILEALHICSIGRSPRTRKDSETVAHGKRNAEIKLDYTCQQSPRSVGVNISLAKGKIVVLDGVPSQKVSDLVGNFASVYFSPDEINIVRGGPQYRRRFMDIINCQIGAGYMNNLRNMQHALKQRNAILRSVKNSNNYDPALIPWDKQIGAFSIKVMLRRANFVRAMNKYASIAMRILTDNKETLHLTYKTFFDRLTDINVNDFAQEYQEKVRANYVRDIATKTSNIGAHLDDIEIKLGYITQTIDGGDKRTEKYDWINLRTAGSLGQQRTATIALKLGEVFMLSNFYGEKPILFLDDVLSELDANRRKQLMDYCKHFDTIITCTEWDYPAVPDKLFKVDNGEVTEMEINKDLNIPETEIISTGQDLIEKILQEELMENTSSPIENN